MREAGSIKVNVARNPSKNVKKDVSEIQTLTQKAVYEEFKGLTPPYKSARGIDSADSGDGDNAVSEPSLQN